MSEKMIRDSIVEYVFNKEGRTLNTRVAAPEEMLQLYKNKLLEEVHEVMATTNEKDLIEEMADLCTVIHGLISYYNFSDKLLDATDKKATERGAFTKGIVLITEDN